MNRSTLGIGILCLALAPAARAADAEDPARLLESARTPTIDLAGAVALRGVEIELGPALLDVERGVLVPTRIESGRALELLFVGQARFRLEPPDEIEAGQLELFTGERSLVAPVEEAVLVLVSEQAVSRLLDRPPPRELRPELVERFAALHDRWMRSAERRRAGVEGALFDALIGDAAFQHYLALWCRSFELGEFIYQVDPEDVEPVTLARFEPLELSGWERARLRHEIRVQQRKGRWLDMRLEDLGAWDIWVSMDWSPAQGPELPRQMGFEPEHYNLDVTLRRGGLRLDGSARLDLVATSSGRRVVRMDLLGDLIVRAVTDGRGRELFFFRAGNELVVLLPESPGVGERLSLEVRYDGRALNWIYGRVWDLSETRGWYPHTGTVDRATYDVTLRWPRRREMIAAGSLVARGREDRYAWERRRLSQPSIAYSFAFGEFDVTTRRVGHVDLRLATARNPRFSVSAELLAATFDEIAGALEYFERVYGPYPLDELTLALVPRPASQSYLGFITLAESIVQQFDPFSESAQWQRGVTIAHELAHQWWGNVVGWWSYRDQWLSEGMANYSALLYDGQRSGRAAERLAILSAGWRDSLGQTTLEGRTIESLGPIVLGNRLNSSRARNAYRTIVYRKGAVVLAMLARAVGEERFQQMLGSLAEAASNKALTTESFVLAIERMSGLDLDGFARQYIYGTGIPEVYYLYDTTQDPDGGWRVEGEARLLSAPRYAYRIARAADDRWLVLRSPGPAVGRSATTLMVPYHVTLDGLPGEGSAGSHSGQLFLQGRRDAFRIETGSRPVDLQLDPRGEVLAWFYSMRRHPKRVLRYEAAELALEGRLDEAEARFDEALALGADAESDGAAVDPLGATPSSPRLDDRLEDLHIRLGLVRIQLERNALESAEASLDRIDDTLVGKADEELLRMERDVLRSLLDLRRGATGAAQRRLGRALRMAAPEREHRNWSDRMTQQRLSTERAAITEGFALLAVAAHENDDRADLEWALREARDRGVDVAALAREVGWAAYRTD